MRWAMPKYVLWIQKLFVPSVFGSPVNGSHLNVITLIELICQAEATLSAKLVTSVEVFLCSLYKYWIF